MTKNDKALPENDNNNVNDDDDDDDDNVVVATVMGSPNAKEIGIFPTP